MPACPAFIPSLHAQPACQFAPTAWLYVPLSLMQPDATPSLRPPACRTAAICGPVSTKSCECIKRCYEFFSLKSLWGREMINGELCKQGGDVCLPFWQTAVLAAYWIEPR